MKSIKYIKQYTIVYKKIRRNDQQEQTLFVRLTDTSHSISHLDRFTYRDLGLEINFQIFGHRKN